MANLIKRNPSFLKIIAWNANGIPNKILEFRDFLAREKVDVALISETHLKPNRQVKVPNFDCYRTDRLNGRAGGTAIYIKNSIKHEEVVLPTDLEIECTCVKISTSRGYLFLVACYNPPKSRLAESDFRVLSGLGDRLILAGDFNAKHINFNSNITNANGRRLNKFADDFNLVIKAPLVPTRLPFYVQHRPDVLDLVIFKNTIISSEVSVLYDLPSDHLPLSFEWGNEPGDNPVQYKKFLTSWKEFQSIISQTSFPADVTDLNERVSLLESTIQRAHTSATTVKIIKHPNYDVPRNVVQLIQARRRVVKSYLRTFSPADAAERNRLGLLIKQALQEKRDEIWQNKLESLSTEDGSLWGLSKALRRGKYPKIPTLRTDTRIATSDQDKSELFAECIKKVSNSEQPDEIEHQIIVQLLNANSSNPGTPLPLATCDEIKNTIKNLANNKAPGPDGISNLTLKYLPDNAIKFYQTIVNQVLETGLFPTNWKIAKIIMIAKPGKSRSDPENYRPISLLPTLGKLTERLILSRLEDECDELSLLPKEQFGFRRSLGTELQLLRITEMIHEALDHKDVAIGVFLDIRRAFDTVWHQGLLSKLHTFKLNPSLIRIISGFLQDRSFFVSVGDATSSKGVLRAGVPQGAVLSPSLYNLYTADFPKAVETYNFIYADDVALVASSRDENLAHRRVQSALNEAAKYFSKWKLCPHPAKSQTTIFTTRRNLKNNVLQLNGEIIPRTNTSKYLGILLDKKLTWAPHIQAARKKGAQAFGMSYP